MSPSHLPLKLIKYCHPISIYLILQRAKIFEPKKFQNFKLCFLISLLFVISKDSRSALLRHLMVVVVINLLIVFKMIVFFGIYSDRAKGKGASPRERAREVKTFSRLRIFLVEEVETNAQLSVLLFRSVRGPGRTQRDTD